MSRPGSGDTGDGTPQGPVPALVQLTSQARLLQPEVVALMKKVQMLERNFDQRERELAQRQEELEESKREIEMKRERARAEIEIARKTHESAMRFERDHLQQEWKNFEETRAQARRSARAAIEDRDDVLTVEVGGEKFRTTMKTLGSNPDSNLLRLAAEVAGESPPSSRDRHKHIFIDRDSKHFRLILNFLRQGEEVLHGSILRGADRYVLHDILCEVRYYKLSDLERLIQRRVITLDKALDFQHLVTVEHCFASLKTTTTSNFKSMTTKSILLKQKNLTGITFDRVYFKHATSFEGSVLVGAKFRECFFEAAITFVNADLYQASFDHCEGLDFERLLFRGANMDRVTFNPPLTERRRDD